jgi:hypothetical protein
MTLQQVEDLLDVTHPEWRQLDPMKFQTYAGYKKRIGELVDDGAKQLGFNLEQLH